MSPIVQCLSRFIPLVSSFLLIAHLNLDLLAFGSMKNPFLFEKSLDQKVPEVIRRWEIFL
jgi:hypothetical protein